MSYQNEDIELALFNLNIHYFFYEGLSTQNEDIINTSLEGLAEVMKFSGPFVKKDISIDVVKKIFNFQDSKNEIISTNARQLIKHFDIIHLLDLSNKDSKNNMDIC